MSDALAEVGFTELARRADIVRRALKVMAVVGLILITINHGDAILAGEWTAERMMKMTLTLCVPYCVSTYSSVAAIRRHAVGGD